MKFIALSLLFAMGIALAIPAPAQDINATVAPNQSGSDNFVDIRNTGTTEWFFTTNPTPSTAVMARVDSQELSVYDWPTTGQFQPDPGNDLNRVYEDEYLRVYPNTLAAGTVIHIPFAYSVSGPQYNVNVTVVAGPQVTAITLLDPTPSVASVVHWKVTFDRGISGVTTTNFALAVTGLNAPFVLSVTPDDAEPSTNWTVAADTGTGTGLLGLDWSGHVTETPSVPNSFVGVPYAFYPNPIVDVNPTNAVINTNMTATLTANAVTRGSAADLYCQWYSGDSAHPNQATPINGATSRSYTPPLFTALGNYNYFCQFYVTNGGDYTSDSTTAAITVVDPPQITNGPASITVAIGRTGTLTVYASGTNLTYQWYGGSPPNRTNPVGTNGMSFTTPILTEDTNYWVEVSNDGPAVADSSAAAITIVASLMDASSDNFTAIVGTAYANSFAVLALDLSNNPVANVPVTFIAAPGNAPSGTFSNDLTSVTVDTGPDGTATAPQFTANLSAGKFKVNGKFAPLTVAFTATNLPTITSSNGVTFISGLSNSFAATELGLPAPTFSFAGALPAGVHGDTAGNLAGIPSNSAAGNYSITIQAMNGSGLVATQNFTLAVLDSTPFVARPNFNTNGFLWTFSGDTINGGASIGDNDLFLTDYYQGEVRGAWFEFPLYIGAFEASFVYVDDLGSADGVSFVLQNDPNGTSAVGFGGSGLGYSGIMQSAALLINISNSALGGAGIMLGTNGVGALDAAGNSSGRAFSSIAPLSLVPGDPLTVNLLYSNAVLTATITDPGHHKFTASYPVDIPSLIGQSTAWVGFTGSDVNAPSILEIANFEFAPLPTVSMASATDGAAILTWPSSIAGYQVEMKTNLTDPTWTTIPTTITQTNGQNQAILPTTASGGFYRLVLPPN